MSSETFCLKWNNFQENIRISFAELRDDNDLSDATLACEDKELEAHKVVLSSCSPFFKRLLKSTSKHQHPIIYMRGLKADQLKAVVNFIYYGEVNIVQEKLEAFLELANELELKGLMGTDAEEIEINTKDPPTNLEPKTELETNRSQPKKVSQARQTLVPTTEFKTKTKKVHIDEDTFQKRDTLFERSDYGILTCIVCSFTSSSRGISHNEVIHIS